MHLEIPLLLLEVGTHGPFTTERLPAALTEYVVDFTNDSNWPASGDVVTAQVDVSTDDGASWAFDASITFAGGEWKDRKGAVLHTAYWRVTVPDALSPMRKLRLSFEVLQACTLGATVHSV